MEKQNFQYKIVFSDVDGTLLNSRHQVLPSTLQAIYALEASGLPFVIISARSPSGIYPILREYGFRCPIIAYSGALILNKNGEVLYQKALPRNRASEILHFAEEKGFDLSWCLYSLDDWLVKDKSDPRIRREEQIVKACSRQGTADSLPEHARIHKILCICTEESLPPAEEALSQEFPDCTIVRSSETLLEIMEKDVSKARAMREFCSLHGFSPREAIAFGDHYNDLEMLREAGCGILMGNAPRELKAQIPFITYDNDHDGISAALKKLHLI